MNESYSLGLALFDFLPVTLFLIGAYYLVRISLMARGRPCSRMVMAGTLLVFLGGFFKAGWKLLYTTGVADIQWMSQGQFVFSGIGFLAMCVAVILMARGQRRSNPPRGGIMLGMAAWKIPFLLLMTVTSLGANGILTAIAFRRRAFLAAAGYILAVLGILAMGALASAEQTVAMQWVEETVNTIGQAGFLLGSAVLHRNYRTHGCDNPKG